MSSPTLVYRELTVNFARSVNAAQQPQTVQVVITPLDTSTSVPAGATFVEAPATRDILLAQDTNEVIFSLVPSDLAGLSSRLLYRIAWRIGGLTGRTYTYDFAMPDADVTFEQLTSLNYVLGGETYLQQADLGVAGRVARLNAQGEVVNAAGIPVAGQASVTALQTALNTEIANRQQAVTTLSTQLNASFATQFNQAVTTAASELTAARNALQAQITATNAAATSLANTVSANQAATTTAVNNLTDAVDEANTTLDTKADLIGGLVPLSQLPVGLLRQGVTVNTEAEMLALTASQVSQFEFVARPDGLWVLVGTNRAQLASWLKVNPVATVNGQTGAVSLGLGDVAAVGGSISQSQVTGLPAALTAKADASSLTALGTRVGAIEADTTIVKTVGGVIPHGLNDDRMAYIDPTGQFLVRKDGTLLSTAGGGPHAASHGAGGLDPITISQGQVTGLSSTLANHTNRLGSLEGRVTSLESGGASGASGGIGVNLNPVPWWSATAPTGDFADDVTLHSPFGYNPTNPAANPDGFYFDPAGAATSEVRFPYITANGHLELRVWNEDGPPDPVLATAADLSALTTVVNGKASQTDLTALSTTVGGKASQTDLTALTATVATKASQSSVDGLSSSVATKASQAALDMLSAAVDTKAAQSALDSTAATVASHTTALTAKADLVSGTVPLTQLPSLPQSKITNLSGTLSVKADLTDGTVPLNQIPTAIPQANIADLSSTLAAKADLVDGKLATSQLPTLALTSVSTVASQAAMLALTDVQPGDLCIITTGADKGSYILTAADPSVLANWTLAASPIDAVTSVNGQTGTVSLDAADVGALASDAVIPQSQVTNLTTDLAGKLSSSALTSALNNRVTWSATAVNNPALETLLAGAVPVKQRATYVRTVNLLTLSGNQQRSDDGTLSGTLMAVGSTVLLTAQTASAQNGLWLVNSGAWTRVADMAVGSYLLSGTVVTVSSGVNADTLWQATSASGVVDTAANNWAKIGHIAAPYDPVAGNGIAITGTSPTQVITASAASGGGISVSGSGIGIDSTIVARKYAATVPGSATNTVTITHNLNTRVIMVSVQAASTGVGVLVGWQATGLNTVELEFNSPPSSGAWSILVIG